jgi:hypothetical protein
MLAERQAPFASAFRQRIAFAPGALDKQPWRPLTLRSGPGRPSPSSRSRRPAMAHLRHGEKREAVAIHLIGGICPAARVDVSDRPEIGPFKFRLFFNEITNVANPMILSERRRHVAAIGDHADRAARSVRGASRKITSLLALASPRLTPTEPNGSVAANRLVGGG